MGEKDITEKLLEDYNDVFADIVNVLLFDGREVVKEDSLESTDVHSQYKADDSKVHELERDVIKYWKDGNVRIALFGIENQTSVDKLMPFRVMAYDGASYKSQMSAGYKSILPVITFVLYFGKERWKGPKRLKECLDIPTKPSLCSHCGLDPHSPKHKVFPFCEGDGGCSSAMTVKALGLYSALKINIK